MRFKHLASREYLTVAPFGLACENARFFCQRDGPKPIHLEDIANKDQVGIVCYCCLLFVCLYVCCLFLFVCLFVVCCLVVRLFGCWVSCFFVFLFVSLFVV